MILFFFCSLHFFFFLSLFNYIIIRFLFIIFFFALYYCLSRSSFVMTTIRLSPSDLHYPSDEFYYTTHRTSPRKIYSYPIPSEEGVVVSKRRSGTYNIVEKDFGEHRVVYHIPIEYGDHFDVTQLEDIPIFEEQKIQKKQSPQLVRRRIIQQYQNYDYDDENDVEYVEEVPVSTSRKHVFVPAKHSPRKTVEYVYEEDQSDPYEYQIDDQPEQVEYIVKERKPKQTVNYNFYTNYKQSFSFSFSVQRKTSIYSTYSLCRRISSTCIITITTTTSSTAAACSSSTTNGNVSFTSSSTAATRKSSSSCCESSIGFTSNNKSEPSK